MKTQKRARKINKPILIIASALLLGLIAFSVYAFVLKPNNHQTTTRPENTTSDKQQSENKGTNFDAKTNIQNTDVPAVPTIDSESNKKQVKMVISVEQSNGTIFIRGGVNYPVSGGTCYVQLSGPSGKSIRKDSEILPNPASTDCKTISISESELTPGKWTFTLKYESDEYIGVSNEASFNL